MPKVLPLTRKAKVTDRVDKQIKGIKHDLKDNNITYQQIADVLGITPQAICYQMKHKSISFDVLVAIQMLIEGEI